MGMFAGWAPTDLKFRVFFIIAGGGCWFERTVVHEFIHAFGFHHEQVRSDRDTYVEIIYENIGQGAQLQPVYSLSVILCLKDRESSPLLICT